MYHFWQNFKLLKRGVNIAADTLNQFQLPCRDSLGSGVKETNETKQMYILQINRHISVRLEIFILTKAFYTTLACQDLSEEFDDMGTLIYLKLLSRSS